MTAAARLRWPHIGVAALAVLAIAVALAWLHAGRSGLAIAPVRVGDIPATVFRPAGGGAPAPVVIVAHGFAGSRQLMQPIAQTLAHHGYIVVTFDFPGHGRNPAPLIGGIANTNPRTRSLLDTLDSVARYGRGLPGTDGRLAVLGHSMAGEIVVRYGQDHPDVAATIAISPFAPGITATTPRDLLIVVGALEPPMLRDEAFRDVSLAAGGPAEARVTYGHFADGTARRVSLSGGVEHIGVLYSRQTLDEAVAWLDQTFGRAGGDGAFDARGPWIGLLYLGLVALAWPLSRLLPRVAEWPVGAGLRWPPFLVVAVVPMLLTPLLLARAPTTFLPILLGDYLTAHFAVYGLLTAGLTWLVRRGQPERPAAAVAWRKLTVAAAAVTAYSIGAIGWPIDTYLTSFVPAGARLPLVLAVLAGTLPYFVADEWATRGVRAPFGATAITKLCLMVSLLIAASLDLERLFFLFIIVPTMVVFLAVYALFGTWAFRRTWHPLVGAVANALALAWAIAVTFPVVAP